MSLSDRSRLIWVTENYFPDVGGMSVSCDRIVSGLIERSVEITVVHLSKRIDTQTWRTLPTNCLRVFPSEHELALLSADLEKAHQLNPWSRVVSFGGSRALSYGAILAQLLAVPFSTALRGNDLDLGIFDPTRCMVLREALNLADSVAVVSAEKVEKVKRLFAHPHVTWIPNGIDCSRWQALPSDHRRASVLRESIQEACQLKSSAGERRVLGIFGDLKPKKGVAFFVKALLSSGLEELFHLLIMGWPRTINSEQGGVFTQEDKGKSELLEEELFGVRGSNLAVTLLPGEKREGLIPYYLSCDLVCIPSFYEGMPNVLLEAGTLGVPLLVSSAGGMSQIVTHGETGIVFEAGRVESCREALSYIADLSAEELRSIGQRGQEMLKTTYSAQRECESYLKLWKESHVK